MCKWSAVPKREGARRDWAVLSPVANYALLVQVVVCEATGVRLIDLCTGGRGGRRVALARQIAMYLCRLSFAMTLTEIAAAFGRDRTTAAHAIQRIEEAREEARFDDLVTRLEQRLRQRVGEYLAGEEEGGVSVYCEVHHG